jgi:3-hydroxymyristoyl/3-hydroxydecanoyl-(acyl carrier protein) dehydratase
VQCNIPLAEKTLEILPFMTTNSAPQYSVEQLDSMDDGALCQLEWKSLTCLKGRLLELHAEGRLGNDKLAKLPRRPILCIDQIERIDDEVIEASFTFPESAADWAFQETESLEMLFQDQLVGFWGCRKADGIGRALSSGSCKLQQSIDFVAGKQVFYRLEKRKWMENKVSGSGGTAVFNGRILDQQGEVILDTKNVIVGILNPAEIMALREQHGGMNGVASPEIRDGKAVVSYLEIPLYDPATIIVKKGSDDLESVTATQQINPELWPLKFHFKGDPVVPGNFGTHGLIALLKEVAGSHLDVAGAKFVSLQTKKFSGMIFEDPKQIRFELLNVSRADGSAVAAEANLYLEDASGNKMIEDPIYTFKKVTVSTV